MERLNSLRARTLSVKKRCKTICFRKNVQETSENSPLAPSWLADDAIRIVLRDVLTILYPRERYSGAFSTAYVPTRFRQSSCAERPLFIQCARNAPNVFRSRLRSSLMIVFTLRCSACPHCRVPECVILIDAVSFQKSARKALVRRKFARKTPNFPARAFGAREYSLQLCRNTHGASCLRQSLTLSHFKRLPAYALSVVQRRGKALFGSPDDQAIGHASQVGIE